MEKRCFSKVNYFLVFSMLINRRGKISHQGEINYVAWSRSVLYLLAGVVHRERGRNGSEEE